MSSKTLKRSNTTLSSKFTKKSKVSDNNNNNSSDEIDTNQFYVGAKVKVGTGDNIFGRVAGIRKGKSNCLVIRISEPKEDESKDTDVEMDLQDGEDINSEDEDATTLFLSSKDVNYVKTPNIIFAKDDFLKNIKIGSFVGCMSESTPGTADTTNITAIHSDDDTYDTKDNCGVIEEHIDGSQLFPLINGECDYMLDESIMNSIDCYSDEQKRWGTLSENRRDYIEEEYEKFGHYRPGHTHVQKSKESNTKPEFNPPHFHVGCKVAYWDRFGSNDLYKLRQDGKKLITDNNKKSIVYGHVNWSIGTIGSLAFSDDKILYYIPEANIYLDASRLIPSDSNGSFEWFSVHSPVAYCDIGDENLGWDKGTITYVGYTELRREMMSDDDDDEKEKEELKELVYPEFSMEKEEENWTGPFNVAPVDTQMLKGHSTTDIGHEEYSHLACGKVVGILTLNSEIVRKDTITRVSEDDSSVTFANTPFWINKYFVVPADSNGSVDWCKGPFPMKIDGRTSINEDNWKQMTILEQWGNGDIKNSADEDVIEIAPLNTHCNV
jgi:hypothetical protein